jgi:hypothetical protein
MAPFAHCKRLAALSRNVVVAVPDGPVAETKYSGEYEAGSCTRVVKVPRRLATTLLVELQGAPPSAVTVT